MFTFHLIASRLLLEPELRTGNRKKQKHRSITLVSIQSNQYCVGVCRFSFIEDTANLKIKPICTYNNDKYKYKATVLWLKTCGVECFKEHDVGSQACKWALEAQSELTCVNEGWMNGIHMIWSIFGSACPHFNDISQIDALCTVSLKIIRHVSSLYCNWIQEPEMFPFKTHGSTKHKYT